MKRLLLLLISFFLASSAFAQSTTVSGTVSDADSQTWNNGTIRFDFSGGNPPYTWTGGTLNPNTPITATLTSTGTYSASVPDNNQIFPIGSRWKVTTCPAVLPATSGCFISYQTITGATQTLNLAPPAIRFSVPLAPTSIPPISAYADGEIIGGWVGFTYYNLGQGTRICQVMGASTCTTWIASAINAPTGPGPVVNVKGYGAKGDTQQLAPPIQMLAAGTDGCPSSAPAGFCFDIPVALGSVFVAGDIGKIIFGNENSSGINRATPGAITAILTGTGAHAGDQVIVWNGTSGGCGGGCTVTWGTDDTTFIGLAKAAAAAATSGCSIADGINYLHSPTCPILYFPAGGYMTQGGGTATPGISTGVNGTSFIGDGLDATKFFMRPDYNIGTLGGNLGMFLTIPGTAGGDWRMANWSISCGGKTFNFPSNEFISTQGNGVVENIGIRNCGNSAGNGETFFGHSGITYGLKVADPAGGNSETLCEFVGGNSDVYFPFCSNGNTTNGSTDCPNLRVTNVTGGTSTQRITFHGGLVDEGTLGVGKATTCIVNSKDVSFIGTTLTSGGYYGISVDATSEVRCNSCTIAPFGGNGGGDVHVLSGGVFRSTMSKFIAVGAGSGNWLCALTTSCIDDGGNNFSQTTGATFLVAGSAIPYSSLTHTWNTCNVNISPIPNATTITLCNQFIDQNLNLIHIKASSQVTTTCATAPIITISDGTNSQTLTLTSGAATWDSGVITQTFATGGTITVKYDVAATSSCTTPPTNLAVTYSAYAFNSP